MRKLLLKIVFIASIVIFFMACDEIKNSVTIDNQCGETVVVAVMENSGDPSSGVTLGHDQSHDFNDLDYDRGYVFIKSSAHDNTWYRSEGRLPFNRTLTIERWTGSGYEISYWETVRD
jgi:hypothetical protein